MTKLFNIRAIALTLVAGAALAVSAPASAQTTGAAPTLSVPYGDLNPGSADGARALVARIKTAATTVCGGEPDIHQLAERGRFSQCRDEAVSQAVGQVGSPMVTAAAQGASKPVVLAGR